VGLPHIILKGQIQRCIKLSPGSLLTLKVDCRLRKMATALSDILRVTSSLLMLMLLMFCMEAINLEAQVGSLAPDEGTYIYF